MSKFGFRFNRFLPLQLIVKAVTFVVVLGAISLAGVSFPVALPWSLFAAACITFTFDE